MSLRAPYVRKGQRLTPGLWNDLARAVNEGLRAPRDMTSGVRADEIGAISLHEVSRTESTERVFNPDDAEQWVDVEHVTSFTVRNSSTGEVITTYFVQ